jgi:transglycosylase-like protein with SLT domain
MDLVRVAVQACCVGTLLLTMQSTYAAEPLVYCGTSQWQTYISEAARAYAIREDWIRGVMRAESAGCVTMDGKPTRSPAGAMGLMQLMPATWAELKARLHLGERPDDPHDNVMAGAAYLRELTDRYGSTGVFAAYHAGPARYDEYLSTGRPLPAQTVTYLDRVHRAIQSSIDAPLLADKADDTTGAHSELSVSRPARLSAAAVTERPVSTSLFIPLRRHRSAADLPEKTTQDVQHD